jgi:hypothetical protein
MAALEEGSSPGEELVDLRVSARVAPGLRDDRAGIGSG